MFHCYSAFDMKALIIEDEKAALRNLKAVIEEVDYDIDGKPVFYSRQYFRDEVFEQTVLRKKM